MTPIRILHLSDFHFREKDQADSIGVLRGLVDTVKGLVEKGRGPDLIVVTGDIAYSGKQNEYALAKTWFTEKLLPECMLDRENLLMVPGNHDADRDKVTRGTRLLQKSILEKGQKELSDIWDNPLERKDLFGRHDSWRAFVKDCSGMSLTLPYWAKVITVKGLRLGFAGLCSSFMSYADDHGKILLGRDQLNEVFNDLIECDLRIALLHHPESYLHEWDGDSWDRLRQQCGLILRGHLHREKALAVQDGRDFCLELATGCVYSDSGYPNSFHLLELADRSELVITPFLWQKYRWIQDLNFFETEDRLGRFAIGGRLESTTPGNGGSFPKEETEDGSGQHHDGSIQPKVESTRPKLIYICADRTDEAQLKKLITFLEVMKEKGTIDYWHEGMILAGRNIKTEIATQLDRADLVLFLLSADFLAGRLRKEDAQKAMNRHRPGKFEVVPIYLRHCLWEDTQIEGLKLMPANGEPISSWPDNDAAWSDVIKGLKAVIANAGS